MKNLIQSKSFKIGFSIGIILFALLNYFSYLWADSVNTLNAPHRFGFPFAFYESGGYTAVGRFIWTGLIVDLVIAILVSALIGLGLSLWVNRKII